MMLSWDSPFILELCRSRERLAQCFPQDAGDACCLLTMVSGMPTLLDLKSLRCLTLAVQEHKEPGAGMSLAIRYEEVKLEGTLVNNKGVALTLRPVDDAVEWMSRVDSLRVETIAARGRQALRSAS